MYSPKCEINNDRGIKNASIELCSTSTLNHIGMHITCVVLFKQPVFVCVLKPCIGVWVPFLCVVVPLKITGITPGRFKGVYENAKTVAEN